jgi:hypothetical protein
MPMPRLPREREELSRQLAGITNFAAAEVPLMTTLGPLQPVDASSGMDVVVHVHHGACGEDHPIIMRS